MQPNSSDREQKLVEGPGFAYAPIDSTTNFEEEVQVSIKETPMSGMFKEL